jgi:NADH:ubiquinone oxidoreductase subunit 6 (subunit J)
MNGNLLAWIGLTAILSLPLLGVSNVFVLAGAIIMIIGVILMALGR